jgi:GNAT superfamily N-acetyltransferase
MDEHFRTIRLPLSFADFNRLPRHAAYKYEYLGGEAVLTPRPRCYRAVLDLRPIADTEPAELQPLPADEILALDELFCAAFGRTQPLASLDADTALAAARACLGKTRYGGDGPLIESACFQAVGEQRGRPLGAILITLLPAEVLTDLWCYRWEEPPPPDAIARAIGCPHLTWVFVSPWEMRRGLATALLAAAVEELLRLGYRHLASTFLLGNDASTLWHWRCGFRMLAQDSALRQKLSKKQ